MASGRYLALLDAQRALHIAKSAGYAGRDNPDTWANFRVAERWGVTPFLGCMIRMGDKFIRAQNLVRDPANDQVGEPIIETLADLSAYANIGIVLKREETEGPEDPVWPTPPEASDPSLAAVALREMERALASEGVDLRGPATVLVRLLRRNAI